MNPKTRLTANCRQCNVEFHYHPYNEKGYYCSNACHREWQYQNERIPLILEGKGGNSIIRFLKERDGYKCYECGVSEWNVKEITLDIHHIDANHKNNLPENLQFLCPNCHRQTDTWGMKRGRRELRSMGQLGRRCFDIAEADGSIPSSTTI